MKASGNIMAIMWKIKSQDWSLHFPTWGRKLLRITFSFPWPKVSLLHLNHYVILNNDVKMSANWSKIQFSRQQVRFSVVSINLHGPMCKRNGSHWQLWHVGEHKISGFMEKPASLLLKGMESWDFVMQAWLWFSFNKNWRLLFFKLYSDA